MESCCPGQEGYRLLVWAPSQASRGCRGEPSDRARKEKWVLGSGSPHSLLVPFSDRHVLRSEAAGGEHLARGGTPLWPSEVSWGCRGRTRATGRSGVGLTSRKPGHWGTPSPAQPSHRRARGLLSSRHPCCVIGDKYLSQEGCRRIWHSLCPNLSRTPLSSLSLHPGTFGEHWGFSFLHC